jgi:hypothetical protein
VLSGAAETVFSYTVTECAGTSRARRQQQAHTHGQAQVNSTDLKILTGQLPEVKFCTALSAPKRHNGMRRIGGLAAPTRSGAEAAEAG